MTEHTHERLSRRSLMGGTPSAAVAVGLPWLGVGCGTAAAGSQDLDGAKDAAFFGVESVVTHGAVGDLKADDTAAFQRAIDALPDSGGVIACPMPIRGYRLTATVRCRKPAVCIIGMGKPGYNEEPLPRYYGTAIYCDVPETTVLEFDAGRLLHSGPCLENLAFIARHPSVGFVAIAEQNQWTIRDCHFRASAKAISINRRSSDASWGLIDNCSFHSNKYGIYATSTYGFEIRGGRFTGARDATAVFLGADTQHVRISNTLFDDTVGIDCSGGLHHVEGCKFERCPTGIAIRWDTNGPAMSGRGNRVIGCTFGGSGSETGIEIEAGAQQTRVIAAHFFRQRVPIADHGGDTVVLG
jgi:hypothetical protein